MRTRPTRLARGVCALLTLLCAGSVLAQNWSELTPAQQGVLRPFESDWTGFEPEQRQRLIRASERWLALAPEQRQRLSENLRAWESLDPETRAELRALREQRLQRSAGADAPMRRHFESLSPGERRATLERLRNMTPAERRAFREGVLSAQRAEHGEGRHAAFRNLAPSERQRLMRWLDGLTQPERMRFRQQMARLSPESRRDWLQDLLRSEGPDAFRAAVLAGPPR